MVRHNVILFFFKTKVIDPLIDEGQWPTKLFYGVTGQLKHLKFKDRKTKCKEEKCKIQMQELLHFPVFCKVENS